MNAQEAVQYKTAKQQLDGVYGELEAIKAEFRDLVAAMAAQLLAEDAKS